MNTNENQRKREDDYSKQLHVHANRHVESRFKEYETRGGAHKKKVRGKMNG
jgi:hypothetical protein